ncbi:hypothetical protein HanXRQr2_Chr17g0784001 [Helianthus annuus]|uniref:Uncharacterized protein n=1 Tax=Helianthus annuus TaxID=4232 RepID=A0A9K3DGD0_HELAN|nr:hypothetical protein HanXRQr2_Chr17g0784001 [Helianthus annuus]
MSRLEMSIDIQNISVLHVKIIWGSFAVPVIEADKCVGVLEFVMDTPKDSSDITGAVYSALEIRLVTSFKPLFCGVVQYI